MKDLKKFKFDIQTFAEGADAEAAEAEVSEESKGDEDINPDDAGADSSASTDGEAGNSEEGDHEKDDDGDGSDSQNEQEEYDFSDVWGENDEVDQQMVDDYAAKFKELNLNKEQANAVMKLGVEFSKGITESIEQAKAEAFAAKEQETVKALGKDLDGTLSLAGAGIEVLSKDVPDLREWLDETGLGNDIKMVRLFAKLGELVSEDSGRLGKGQSVSGGDPLRQRWNNSPEMFKD